MMLARFRVARQEDEVAFPYANLPSSSFTQAAYENVQFPPLHAYLLASRVAVVGHEMIAVA